MNPASTDLSKLRRWLLEGELASIMELADQKKRVLSLLTALTFDPDPMVSDQALTCSGQVAAIIYQRDAEFVRNTLLRLFWMVNDESGGIGWRAPELIGEILHHCPQMDQFFPLLISLLDMGQEDLQPFLTGILWAIGRVAQVARQAMLPAVAQVRTIDEHDESLAARQMARWCLLQLGDH